MIKDIRKHSVAQLHVQCRLIDLEISHGLLSYLSGVEKPTFVGIIEMNKAFLRVILNYIIQISVAVVLTTCIFKYHNQAVAACTVRPMVWLSAGRQELPGFLYNKKGVK